jgi:hypothetical protein
MSDAKTSAEGDAKATDASSNGSTAATPSKAEGTEPTSSS